MQSALLHIQELTDADVHALSLWWTVCPSHSKSTPNFTLSALDLNLSSPDETVNTSAPSEGKNVLPLMCKANASFLITAQTTFWRLTDICDWLTSPGTTREGRCAFGSFRFLNESFIKKKKGGGLPDEYLHYVKIFTPASHKERNGFCLRIQQRFFNVPDTKPHRCSSIGTCFTRCLFFILRCCGSDPLDLRQLIYI